jgi:hypothetical protein
MGQGDRQPERNGARVAGPACRHCKAPLARDQRYCLNCGGRVGPLSVPRVEPPVSYSPAKRPLPIRLPTPRAAGVLAVMTLAFGVFVGVALGPSISGVGFAGGQLVVDVPAPVEDAANGSGGGAATTGGSVALGSPVGNTGGGRSTPQPAAAPVAAIAPPPVAPAPPPKAQSPPAASPSPQPQSPQGGNGPPPEKVPPTSGTVVHVNPVAGSYTLATSGGQLMPIHADHLPSPGAKVSVPVQQLFNGTFEEKGKRVEKGDEKQARLTGYVSYSDPAALVYSLSVRGASLLIHVPQEGSAAPPELPQLGTYGTITAAIQQPAQKSKSKRSKRAGDEGPGPSADQGCAAGTGPDAGSDAVLMQQSAKFTGPPVSYVDMEGIVGATCTDPSQLTLSADDVRESAQNVLFAAPAPIDVTKLKPGQAIDVTAELGDDGSYTVTGLSSDQGIKGASDRSAAQGDQAP